MKTTLLKLILPVLTGLSLGLCHVHATDLSDLSSVSSPPANGTFLSLSDAAPPLPFDPFPSLTLYTDGTNFYYDDRGLDPSQLNGASAGRDSGVVIAGDDGTISFPVGPYATPGFTLAIFSPPAAGYTPCDTYTNFWLQISPNSNVAEITITNTLPGLSYVLLEKTNLSQTQWTSNRTLSASGYTVSASYTNSPGNAALFFAARLSPADQLPIITQAPSNQVVGPGNTAVFVVQAAGLGPLSYQWQSNYVNLVNGGAVSGANTNRLTISPVGTNDATTYTVIVSNAMCYAAADAQLGLTWTNDIGGCFSSSAAIGPDGTIYIAATNNAVYALSPLDGSVQWQTMVGSNFLYYYLNSSPVLPSDGSAVYYGSQDGTFVALNPANGHVLWSNYLGGGIIATPAVGSDGEIYVGTQGNNSIFALNPSTHAVDWNFTNFESLGLGGATSIYASPAIGPDCTTYWLNGANNLCALNRDGSLRWIFFAQSFVVPTSSPCVDADGVVYFGTSDTYLDAVSPLGTLLWLYGSGTQVEVGSSPSLGPDGTVYIGFPGGYVDAVTNGQLAWQFHDTNADPNGRFPYSSPAVAADGTVYIGSGGTQTVFALTNGLVKWALPMTAAINASPTIAQNGAVIIASEDGHVYSLAGSAPPAASPWPMFHQNALHSGAAPNPNCSGLSAPAFFLSNPGLNGSLANFYLMGAANGRCDIYSSTNLSTWTFLDHVQLQSDGTTNFTDTSLGAGGGVRFYQARASDFCSDILGYANLSLAAGTNLITNPFYGDTDYGLGTLFVPQNSLAAVAQFYQSILGLTFSNDFSVIKWDGIGFETNGYTTAGQGWIPNGNATLLPGESAFFVVSNAMTLPFAGRIPRGILSNPIDSRTNYLSSIVPVAGYLQTDLQFDPTSGDIVRLYSPGSSNPTSYTNSGGAWHPSEPFLQVGQGFVLITSNTNGNWQTNFSVCAP